MVGETRLKYVSTKKMVPVDIKDSKDVYAFIKELWYDDLEVIERFLLLNLNRTNSIISYHWISQGGLAGTVIDTRVIFKSAIESLAQSIIVTHNHPSGNTKPSEADITITNKLSRTGEIMEIKLLDHLIITHDSYFSMADDGII